MKMRSQNFLAVTVFFSVVIVLSMAFPVKSDDAGQGAKFTHVTYTARIQAGTMDVWTFSVYNQNCSENDQGVALFFLRFYADNRLLLDEYNSTLYKTWNCSKGNTISRSYNIKGWNTIHPATHDIRIELYWYHNGVTTLEDTASFAIAVTVYVSLQNIYATGYLAAYLIVLILLFSYDYVQGLEE